MNCGLVYFIELEKLIRALGGVTEQNDEQSCREWVKCASMTYSKLALGWFLPPGPVLRPDITPQSCHDVKASPTCGFVDEKNFAFFHPCSLH